ncbi:Phosphoglycolate phosphatase 1A, chloroplastic [Capsicum baccatum]|uniref:phosphoglycolate phosphatase n=1 Tax=Capsicum baccatum TaxID=33114 RepID=A0A2G2WU63_CAPBA|nr:Phosphoglycolate phosphatase 1A, chloroplastic [Capsicum baccatum]
MQYAKKFHSLGIPVNEDEIFLSSFSAAMYLKVNDFPREKKVYVIGEEGILEELEQAGFTALGGPADGKKNIELKSNCLFQHGKSVGAVIVGLDQYINFYKLQYATLCIRENPGCLFIATNRDAVGHLTDLQEWPGIKSIRLSLRPGCAWLVTDWTPIFYLDRMPVVELSLFFQGKQEIKKPKYVQISVESYSHLTGLEDQVKSLEEQVSGLEDEVKDLNEKLAAAQSEITNKENLGKQYAKVAEEAVSGWEKAESKAATLKNHLESVTLLNLTAN